MTRIAADPQPVTGLADLLAQRKGLRAIVHTHGFDRTGRPRERTSIPSRIIDVEVGRAYAAAIWRHSIIVSPPLHEPTSRRADEIAAASASR